jgi:hypothetical protein
MRLFATLGLSAEAVSLFILVNLIGATLLWWVAEMTLIGSVCVMLGFTTALRVLVAIIWRA